MGEREFAYDPVSFTGAVTNESISADLIDTPGTGQYLVLNKMLISVYLASVGTGGICEIKDTSGVIIHTISTDNTKDVSIDLKGRGIELGTNRGLQALVSGAAEQQASVSFMGNAQIDFRS